jgi:hypothetical protein
MELQRIRIEPSPLDAGRVRLAGEVVYDDRPGQVEEYWFDVPEDLAPSLSRSGNPWLTCLVPLAATLGQKLTIRLPVDRILARNVRELVAVWRSWYPRLHAVDFEFDFAAEQPTDRGERVGSFFTAGVDSYFTALRSQEPGAIPTDDLVTVWGFDVPLADRAAFERRRERLSAIAEELGARLVDVATNLRSTRLKEAEWGGLWHGAALASVGHALGGRYRRLLVASTWNYGSLVPLGSHPLTDPLLSSSTTQVVHDGATHNRFEKLEYIARSETALRNLHVCFRAQSDYNCGSCEKCMRTMAILEVLNRLTPEANFPGGRLDVARFARTFIPKARAEAYYVVLRAEAKSRGRQDIVLATDRIMARSRRLRRLMAIPNWLSERRGLWRVAGPIRRALLARAIV